jgi:hypothetical protein
VITAVARGARGRFAAGGALLACVTMLVTACSGSSGSSASGVSGTASVPAVSSSAGSAPAGSPPAPASSSSAPASPPPTVSVAGSWTGSASRCPDLSVKLGLAQGTSKTTYQVLEVTNHGASACILAGYPGVNLAGGDPVAPIGLPAGHSTSSAVKPITLQPGRVANSLLQITNASTYPAATCRPVHAQDLVVYFPDQAPARIAYATTACSKSVPMLVISALVIGTGS